MDPSVRPHVAAQQYERQRRRFLLHTLLPIALLLTGVGWLSFTLYLLVSQSHDDLTWLRDGIVLLLVVGFGGGVFAERCGHLRWASGLVIVPVGVGIFVNTALWMLAKGLDLYSFVQLAGFGTVILAAGVLGNLRAIIGATLWTNAVTVGLLVGIAALHPLLPAQQAQFGLLLTGLLIYQWVFGVVMGVLQTTYQLTLRQLGRAYEREAQLDALKDQFITHVNHELRTPIMALQGHIEYLLMAHEAVSAAERTALLERASRTGDALATLLSQVLDVRWLTSTVDVPLQAVNVRQTMETVLPLLVPYQGSERPLTIVIGVDVAIWGEETRLQQILLNLVSNALKYSPPGTPVTVRAQPDERRLPWVEITVQDRGAGIPPEQADLLFRRFVRLPRDLASPIRGSGLGLYLCRTLAEAMGGSIRLLSSGRPGEGSTFVVRLPSPPAATGVAGIDGRDTEPNRFQAV